MVRVQAKRGRPVPINWSMDKTYQLINGFKNTIYKNTVDYYWVIKRRRRIHRLPRGGTLRPPCSVRHAGHRTDAV